MSESDEDLGSGQQAPQVVGVISPEQLKWQARVFQQKGWTSKRTAQVKLVKEMVAAFRDLDGATLQPGQGNDCSAKLESEKLDPGKEFKAYLAALKQFESAPEPRDPALAGQLRDAANAYVAHYNKHSGRQKKQSHTKRKYETCLATLAELRKFELRDEFDALGRPPWASEQAMKAASIKATLDFQSLPSGAQQVETPEGGENVNPTFWVNKQVPDPTNNGTKTVKTYLFKPQTTTADVDGFPVGGEPAREALAGRAADILNGMTGIDFKFPETHVVALDRAKIPPEALDTDTAMGMKIANADGVGPLTGSLQQFAPTNGAMRDQPPGRRWRIPKERVQQLAVLDLVTLNCDRHGGNFLMTGDGQGADLVPIDHGLTFPDGKADLAARVGGSQNALLGLPGAHEPFSQDMTKKIGAIRPDALAAALGNERKTLETVHGSTQGMVTDESIEMSRRSAMFLKLAAATLSPALVQIALGQNAKALFDPSLDDTAFGVLAQRIIRETSANKDVLAEFHLASPDERARRDDGLKANGWSKALASSPLFAMALYKQDAKMPAQTPVQRLTPLEEQGVDQQEVAELKAALPRVNPTGTALKTAIPEWRAIKALGGKAKLDEAFAALNLPEQEIRAVTGYTTTALEFLQQYVAAETALDNPPQDGGAASFMRKKLATVLDLARLLPKQQQSNIAPEIKKLAEAAKRGPADPAVRRRLDMMRDTVIGVVQPLQLARIKVLAAAAPGQLDGNEARNLIYKLVADGGPNNAEIVSRQGAVLEAAKIIKDAENKLPGA